MAQGDPLWGKQTQPGAEPHPQTRDGKVDQGEHHARETIADIDQFVDKDDANGGHQVEDYEKCDHSIWLRHDVSGGRGRERERGEGGRVWGESERGGGGRRGLHR